MKKPILYSTLGLVVIILIIAIAASSGSKQENTQPEASTGTEEKIETPTPLEPTQTNPAPPPPSITQIPTTPQAPQNQAFTFSTPKANTEWIMNQNNLISWNKTLGTTGGLYLINASNGETVGWITSNLGTNQTSYNWDTRDVFLSRGSGLKKNIEIGQYIIKLKFDNLQPEIQSPAFSIIYPSQAKPKTHETTILNATFYPETLLANQKETIQIKNSDSIAYTLTPLGFGAIQTIQPGETISIDTTYFTEGTHEFYSQTYPSLKLLIKITK